MRRPSLKNSPRARLGSLAVVLAAAAAVVTRLPAPAEAVAGVPVKDGARGGDAGRADAAAASDASKDEARRARIPPDPPAMNERHQWVFDLRWDRGEVYLIEVHKVDLGAPQLTPRAMGRFALELYEGPTLIERVRFDFPMLGAPIADAGFMAPPRFEPKLKTRIGVLFPATGKGTRLELWDRARDVRWQLPWPPKEGPVTPPADGG